MYAVSIFKNFTSVILIFGLFTVLACTPNSINYQDQIVGNWEVEAAFRNEKPTATLENAFFNFQDDGKMKFNLDGLPREGQYELKGKKIVVEGSKMDTEYKIENLTDSTMTISGIIRGLNFTFNLTKTER